MRKAAIAISTLVLLVGAAVALIASLSVTPKFIELMTGAGEKGKCSWEIVALSLTTSIPGFKGIPEECTASYINITKKELDKLRPNAKKRIEFYTKNSEKYYGMLREGFNNPDDERQQYEWALNQLITDQLKNCWDKVLQGKVPIFSKWWDLYHWPGEKERPNQDKAIELWEKGPGINYPPINCIVCSRIEFRPDAKQVVGERAVNSLTTWLKYEHPRYKAESYFEYLADGQTLPKTGSFNIIRYPYNTRQIFAVVYERINAYKTMEVLNKLGITEKGDYSILRLVPYDEIAKPLSDGSAGEGCTLIVD